MNECDAIQAVTFQSKPLVQNLGNNLLVTCYFQDAESYAQNLDAGVVIYRAMDDHRIVGCALLIRRCDF